MTWGPLTGLPWRRRLYWHVRTAQEYAETTRACLDADPRVPLSLAEHVDTVAHWAGRWNPKRMRYVPRWRDWLTAVIAVAWCRWEWWRTPAWLKDPDTILYLPEQKP